MSPTVIVPASGCSWPVSIRNRVVLPAPLGPMMPTMPAVGSENDRSSMSRRSPKPLREALDLDDHVAEARPGGDGDLEPLVVALGRLGLGLQLVVGGEAGLALGLAGLGRHAHPLELALERAPAGVVGLLLLGQAGLLLLQPASVVALERDAAAAVELEDPAGDVVEEVAVVGDGHDRAGVLLQEALEPRRPPRRRGGWSARRAAAGRARLSSSRHSATRRRSPPERVVTSASSGGQRRASMAISTLRSRLQASAASILSSSAACSAPILS